MEVRESDFPANIPKDGILMKRLIARLLAAAMILSCLTSYAFAGDTLLMTDVQKGAWYYTAVRSACQQGLLTGISPHTFAPNQPLTRGELIRALGAMAGIDPADYAGKSAFSDVTGDLIPYVNWAASLGVANGTGSGAFSPEEILTRETYAALAGSFVTAMGITLPEVEFPQWFSDEDQVSDWARSGYELLAGSALLQGDSNGNFHPASPLTRAQAAVLLTRLGRVIQEDSPVVYDWLDVEALGQWESPVISPEELLRVAEEWGFGPESAGFAALCRVNDYGEYLSDSDREGTLVFLFEGAGANPDTSKRMNALCLVISGGEVTYVNQNSSTIPDDPFDPKKNEGMAMPTLNSGIYWYTSVNQPGAAGSYAALNVLKANVVRFRNSSSFYQSTSTGINVHRRNSNSIAPASATWANSFGCCLIGQSGTGATGEYARFIQAVGLVDSGASGASLYSYKVSGKVIVDRSMAEDYMLDIGYPQEAIDMIG